MLQLHGNEPPERVAVVRSKFGLPVMKAVPIADRGDLSPIRAYARVADRLLFDARAPREATRPGGLGKAFDWTLLKGVKPGVPFMLSGGLDAGNVAEAMGITGAPGVDVSSGVERSPGVKDLDKIRAFIRAARAADVLELGASSDRERHHDRAAAQFLPHRSRRARAFRHLWRPLRRRDADAADPRSGAAYDEAKADPAFQQGDGRTSRQLCRPAVAALFRRAADRASAAAPKSTSSARSSTTPARTR